MPAVVLLGLLGFLLMPCMVYSQEKVISLYDGAAPGSENWNWEEKETSNTPIKLKVAYNISRPTLSVFLPEKELANGTSVIVFPGGGFHVINIDHEGVKLAEELNKAGVTVFVLKYRVVHSLTDDPWQEMTNNLKDPLLFSEKTGAIKKLALADAVAAMTYVRQHAADYNLDTGKIGLIGFSAGGFLATNILLNHDAHTRPAFAGVIYAGIQSDTAIKVPEDAAPLFIAAATDDQLLPVQQNVELYNLWIQAGKKAELHLYARGGHGLRIPPANSWSDRFKEWLQYEGFIVAKQ